MALAEHPASAPPPAPVPPPTPAPVPPADAFPARRVYAVVGVPPEVQAYAMAKYSRSSQGMLESIRELSQQQAAAFLDTFYFQYGHRSIADLAHLVFGVEQVSILAAIALVDEPVWDGQERSTRYQPFKKTGWYTPPSLLGTPAAPVYRQASADLFAAYDSLTQRLVEHLAAVVPRPEALPEAAYRRTLRARAFDVSRSLLPLATHTSVGQVVSARVLERQVSRLLTSEYPEVRAIGAELKEACQRPAEVPLLARQPAPAEADVAAGTDPASLRAAPTLVKYAAASAHQQAAARALREAAATYLASASEPDRQTVDLVEPGGAVLEEVVATLLYRHDAAGRSFRQALACVRALSEAQQREVLDLSLRDRGRHDDLLREHQAGYALVFDVLMDVGSFRDLHRHRRCVQVPQALTWEHGFEPAEDVFAAGLGPEAAAAALREGLGGTYTRALAAARQSARQVAAVDPLAADYLLPLAQRVRCLFKMDWAEAAYIVEQRTAPAGHFSYRRVAWAMYQALRQRHPLLAEPIRATDPYQPFDVLQR